MHPAFTGWDRELMVESLGLDDRLQGRVGEPWASYARAIVSDVDALGDALVVLCSEMGSRALTRCDALPRIYAWARDVVLEITEAIDRGDDPECMGYVFASIASRASLFVDGLFRPALATSIAEAAEDRHAEDVDRLLVVDRRVLLLKWTLSSAAGARS
jgi:hypothetical protein